MSFAEGVKLPLGILTASAALYNKEHLQLPFPRRTPEATGKTLLVWGGSSNVGIAAIQLAIASGVDVVAVASQKNQDLVRNAGAGVVVDHSSTDVIDDLVKLLRGRDVLGAFDGTDAPSSCHQCLPADSASAIGSVEATQGAAGVLSGLGGGKLRSVFNRFDDIDATVEAKQGRSTRLRPGVSMADRSQSKP